MNWFVLQRADQGKCRGGLGKGFKSPLFIVTSLENADAAIDLYLQRMKIELMFRDLKSTMGIDKNMSLKRENMQSLMVLAMLAFTMAVVVGEKIREAHYDQKKRACYSGRFLGHHLRTACPTSPPKVSVLDNKFLHNKVKR